MALADTDLKGILLSQNYLSAEDIATAEQHAKAHEQSLQNSLFDLGLLTQGLFESAVAEHYGLPYRDFQQAPPDPEKVNLLPEAICRQFHAVVVDYDGASNLTVATCEPGTPDLEQAIRLNFQQTEAVLPGEKPAEEKKGLLSSFARKVVKEERGAFAGKITFVYAPASNIEGVLVHMRKPLATRFQAILDGNAAAAPEILDEILRDAQELRASDIHFEPQRDKVSIVRFRVDGVLHEAGRIPKEHYDAVINRIKIASNMRTDEHYAAQDGAIRYEGKGAAVDVRVSIVPVVDGEKVVMRVLSQYVRSVTLADLGFSDRDRELLEANARKPFGMILTTGPTGSGKSTTLYALMKMRNHPDINISTIEDPVEYKLQGVNHIQVNPKTNLTFATGLRALVRQDPDVILVGEIRDGETADISVNAALTGHLVFSTLHANDAATAVPRLIEMGVEPFLLASTLELVMAQRLVRRLCPQCRYSYTATRAELLAAHPLLASYIKEDSMLLYRGKGCGACGNTGFKGRIGIYELLEVTPEMEALITGRATSNEINDAARRAGMHLLFDDGFDKMCRGVTSLEELLRVASPSPPLESKPVSSPADHGHVSRD